MATGVSRLLLATGLACVASAAPTALEARPAAASSPPRTATVVATPDLICGTPAPPPRPEPEPEPDPDPGPEPDPVPTPVPSPAPGQIPEIPSWPYGYIPTPSSPWTATSVERRGDFGAIASAQQAVGDEHEYFERLKAMSGALCAYSLRSQDQINQFSCAGSGCLNGVVTYAPAERDEYHSPQDAARFEIRGEDHP